ncbi:GMP synthase [Coccidioides immitis H538.4]|uniref:GMP synthase n=1 Tax=Coccidioides immitis H538.4 TaxID=396776 RepID=A0A0J8RPW2_COCIT|nr:GMP synthase [Coccidioides immitis H538.4]
MDSEQPPHSVFDTILPVRRRGNLRSQLAFDHPKRELNVYSEMVPCTQRLADLTWKPKGVILSGGPYSVYEQDAPHVDPAFLELGVPILGICYGIQELAYRLDKANLPEGFHTIATTANSEYAGIAHETKPIYGIQFHPEVTHTPDGTHLLKNFAVDICGAAQNWTMAKFVDQEITRIRKLVGETDHVLGAVSGGVDSTVASKLMKEAIGDRFHAVLVNNGCMRLNECEQVHETLGKHLGINLTVVDASKQFLDALKGVTDPERKRKIIGGKFIDVFEAEALKIEAGVKHTGAKVKWFLQGTLYPGEPED